MNLSEVANFLQTMSGYDSLLGRKSAEAAHAQAQMWCELLHPGMTAADARDLAVDHYRRESRTVTAADLNTGFKKLLVERARRLESDRLHLEIESARAFAVPMPDEIRAFIRGGLKSPLD
jgi:hypothetical protein